MVMWGAVVALIASLLVLGPLAESAPAWAGEAALLLMALSALPWASTPPGTMMCSLMP